MILKLNESRVAAFAQFARKSEEIIVALWMYQKLISHSATRWLSLYPSLPRMLQMYPVSHLYFMSIDKPTVVLRRFPGNSPSEFCLTHLDTCNHFWLRLMSKFRLLRSQKHQLLILYRVSQCWKSQIFFLLRKVQIRNENWIRLLRMLKVRKCKAFAPQ